jgi:hypothetical protein
LEVDFLVDQGNSRLTLIEVKATKTPQTNMGTAMARLAKTITNYSFSCLVVHQGTGNAAASRTLGQGIKAIGVEHLPAVL